MPLSASAVSQGSDEVSLEEFRRLAKGGNKYHAARTWSELCNRWFDSKAEARRGEALAMLERAGEIRRLEYQPRWVLSDDPRVTYKADFAYWIDSEQVLGEEQVIEDVKGALPRDTRTKLAWLKQKYRIKVRLLKPEEV